MNDKLFDFNNPYTAFVIVSTTITIAALLSRFLLKFRMLLWKSTLISYIVFVSFIFISDVFEHQHIGLVYALSAILLVPGMLIYGLIPGVIKPCPSDFDVFGWHIAGFLFYTFIIWGIMKIIKQRKEIKTAEKRQDDNVEKQPPSGTDLKGA